MRLYFACSDELRLVGGGGSDAYPFMDTMLDAIRGLGAHVPFNTLMVTGPFMPAREQGTLSRKAMGLPVVVRPADPDWLAHVRHADLVVSMAGYNTVCEVLKSGKQAIVVPRPGPSA